jgi:AraC-like DNA-binding protein
MNATCRIVCRDVLEYREYAPVPSLVPVVERLWTLAGGVRDVDEAQAVLPDGRPELVVHLGHPFERIEADGQVTRQAPILFAGQLSRRLVLRPAGPIAVLGVRFHPFGAAALLRPPQHEMVGLTLGTELLGAALRADLECVRECGPDFAAARGLVQEVLRRRLDLGRIDRRVARATASLTRGSPLSVEAAATEVGLTRRHLERRFLDQVGLSPKRLARIARFSRAVQTLERGGGAGRGALGAAANGYADQAHFIREFRELAGCPPGRHLLERGQLTGFFAANIVRP